MVLRARIVLLAAALPTNRKKITLRPDRFACSVLRVLRH
jgi:hypothetical protein